MTFGRLTHVLAAPLIVLGVLAAVEVCLDAFPACVYTTGNGVAGFYGYGSLFGTEDASALLPLASMEASGEVSSDALALMLGRCSFSPATKVLLADGSTKPIKDVEVGDVVVATDPEEGKTTGKSVTRLYDHLDTDLAEVTVTDRRGVKSILHTTQDHPFWDATTASWTPAGSLRPGDRLSTPTGTATVAGVRSFRVARHMLNLTVAGIHTYYVLAGTAPVLVHNACGELVKGFDSFNAARADAIEQAGLGADRVPFVQEIGPQKGRVTGMQSPDKMRGWRIDFDPRDSSKGFHVNWWVKNGPKRSAGGRVVQTL